MQDRRKEFEDNLEKAGLELETEDKSVSEITNDSRNPIRTYYRPYFLPVTVHLKETALVTPVTHGCLSRSLKTGGRTS